MKVAIIGAGLAGTSLGYVLSRRGIEVCIYEAGASIASGASGNEIGLVNPRLAAHYTPQSQFYSAAFDLAVETFSAIEGIDWNGAGALHLIDSDRREKQFYQTVETWGWGTQAMRIIGASEASEIAGVEIAHECLYLPQAGAVSPRKLCAYYASGLDVRLNTQVQALSEIDADIVVLACGAGALGFKEAAWLPLSTVRGQISIVKATEKTRKLRAHLCYKGAFSAPMNGVHMVGSTFQRWLEGTDVMPADDQDNLDKLGDAVPSLAQEHFDVVGHRAGLRCASKDYFPVIGALPDHSHIYLSTAHGSYGVLSSLMGAYMITDMIMEGAPSLGAEVINALSPERFCGKE